MKKCKKINIRFIMLFVLCSSVFINAQQNRINFNNQNLFLSGSNLAWVSYGRDWGLGLNDTTAIADWMLQMHQRGGNAMRIWLNVEGTITPEFDSEGYVTGPGTKLIPELKKVLDLAWEREIGIDICLWSFNMLTSSLDTGILRRNKLLLTDTSYTNTYIRKCLIPIVEALKEHPAIIAWEIFNEPEGMSTEFGWSGYQHVPMSAIQRVVNLCAGAIHRTDPNAKVTNGTVTMASQSDVPAASSLDQGLNLTKMSAVEKKDLEDWFNKKYALNLTAEQIIPQLKKLTLINYNYYTDGRLIAAGGDPLGVLDFYSVHYYAQNGEAVSVLTHNAGYWNLTKPLVVGEFAVQNTDGIQKEDVYEKIYSNGYAGALAWSWTDENFSTHDDMLAGMQNLWDNHKYDVDLIGTGGDWPVISITNPKDGAILPDTSKVIIEVDVKDDSSAITLVEFFAADTLKISESVTAPYSFEWKDITPGFYRITAAATNGIGHKQKSNSVQFIYGIPATTRFEAETAACKGAGFIVKNDMTASGHKYVDIQDADTNSTLTWRLTGVPEAGYYPVTFGYRLAYESPKTQFLNINGIRIGAIEFTAASTTTWNEKTMEVYLKKDTNTIQLQMFWAWMYLDYLAVPVSIAASLEDQSNIPATFSIRQNYPNPFNPATTINFIQPEEGNIVLKIYDILGREVMTLLNAKSTAGAHSVVWNGKNNYGNEVSSGIYFYNIKFNGLSVTNKMMLIR